MPTYQYACTDCGDKSEVVQRFTDDPLTVCSACGGKLRKVFSPVGIVFKGSGFYKTDSRGAATSSITSDGGDSKTATNGAKSDGAKSEKSDSKTTKSDAPSTTTTKPVSTDAAS